MHDTLVPHSELPDINTARLPATYDAAKHALAECSRLDECQTWANKAEAMASYARQAKDDALRKMCDRIQARAVLRCGELLQEIREGQGARTDLVPREGTLPKLTRTEVATKAGLSEYQRKTALRVANIPKADFEAAVESDDPPTVSALAEQGKVEHAYLKGREPSDFERATRLIGLAEDIVRRSSLIDLAAAVRGLDDDECHRLLETLSFSIAWLTAARKAVTNAIQPR